MTNYTKKELVDFIAENYRDKEGKRPIKKHLAALSGEELRKIISDTNGDKLLESWANRPKVISYYIDAFDQDNKEYVFEAKGISTDLIKKNLEKKGHTVNTIVTKKGHHLCKYCNGIADGTNTDQLCNDCRDVFGHTFYSEL